VVDEATCRSETEQFIDEAIQKGMLQVSQ
jgi:hypothetical protein